MMRKTPMDARNALSRLRDLCERGEYCTFELRTKLRNWGVGESDSDKIIMNLEADRYVDDERFARAFAHNKAMNSHWGRFKIKLHLAKKRIPQATIVSALDELDSDDYEKCLLEVLASKKRQLGEEADTFEGRTKIFRYAVTKGYEPALVSTHLRAKDY